MLCGHATGVVKTEENMVKLLSENIKDEIFDLFESSEKEINIISPFIGIQTAKEIVKIIKEKNINVTLITRFNRSDFYSKASSLEALNLLSDNNVKILAVKKLHTKLYIIDTDSMILGSSNFTTGGFLTNIELNVLFQNENNDCNEIIGTGIAYFNEFKTNIPNDYVVTKERILNEIEILKTIPRQKEITRFDERFNFGFEFENLSKVISRPDMIESCFSENLITNSTAWLKFEGFSDERRKKGDTIIEKELEEGKYKTYFATKPSGFKTGDLVFLGVASYNLDNKPTIMIYGYGTVKQWQKNQIASQEEKNKNPDRNRWPYYIYFENIKYIHDEACKCIPISDLYENIGADAFPNSVGTNRDVHGMHYQREKLRITDKAKNYLLSELSKRNCI